MEKKEEQLREAAEKFYPINGDYTPTDRDLLIEDFLKICNLKEVEQYHSSNDSVEHKCKCKTREEASDCAINCDYSNGRGDLQKQQESDAWISVEDRLPDVNSKIDVWCDMHEGFRLTNVSISELSEKDLKEFMKVMKYNHWKPTPKSPTIQIKQ